MRPYDAGPSRRAATMWIRYPQTTIAPWDAVRNTTPCAAGRAPVLAVEPDTAPGEPFEESGEGCEISANPKTFVNQSAGPPGIRNDTSAIVIIAPEASDAPP